MAATVVCKTTTTDVEDLLSCNICHNTLEDPRTLSCLHSFCLKCLQKGLEATETATSVCCSTCNTDTNLPASGSVTELGVIAYISRQLKERLMREELANRDTTIKCTACDGTAAESMYFLL